jgi:hypothetical protein
VRPSQWSLTATDLSSMERDCRRQLQREAVASNPNKPLLEPSVEQKLRWYEQSVLEAGMQINGMVHRSMVAAGSIHLDRATSPPLDQQLQAAAVASAGLSHETRQQEAVSLVAGEEQAGNFFAAPDPTISSVSIAADVSGLSGASVAVSLDDSFAQMERRLERTAKDIHDICRAQDVHTTVEEVLREGPLTKTPAAAAACAAAAGLSPGQDSGGAGGLSRVAEPRLPRWSPPTIESGRETPWQEMDGEYFQKYDADNSGTLARDELHKAAAQYLAQGRGEGQ